MNTINKVIEGLQILRKYSNDVCAKYDAIYAGPTASSSDNDDLYIPRVSEEDAAKLEELDWYIDDDLGVYRHFT